MIVCIIVSMTACTQTELQNSNDVGSSADVNDFTQTESVETVIESNENDVVLSNDNKKTEEHDAAMLTPATETSISISDDISNASGNLNLGEIHSIDFHTFTGEMIEYVGEERFNEWFENCDGKDSGIEGCIHYANICRFIEYFDFPKEAFEEAYYGTVVFYFSDYDIDLLYESDESTVSQYYISYADRAEEREKYSSLGEIKFGIAEHAMLSHDVRMQVFFKLYCEEHNITEWSIADFIRTTGIEKNDLETLIKDITVREYPGKTVVLNCFDFDYDALYGIAQEMSVSTEETFSIIDKHNEDMVFCGQPQIRIDI